MKKIFNLFFFIFLSFLSTAQLPGKLDSLIKSCETQKEDTLKVESLLKIAEESANIDTALSGKSGRRAFTLAKKIKLHKGSRRFIQLLWQIALLPAKFR
ncbi:MAG: hypothetical protein IPJ32_10040 [Sphingobacteriaceae bacterium]|nr:hypothetical protein [Sphingobacteriaceae bacterium]